MTAAGRSPTGPAIVADTNVLVYAATGDPQFGAEAAAVLAAAGPVQAPASAPAEILQSLWRLEKAGLLGAGAVTGAMTACAAAIDHVVPVLPLRDRAMELARTHDHSPYDTLFVALAEREGLRVVTFDRKLAGKFPSLCVEPAAFLAANP